MPKKEAPIEEALKQDTVEESAEALQEPEVETSEVKEDEALSSQMDDLDVTQVSDSASDDSIIDEEIDAGEPVTIQPVKFASFEESSHAQGEANKNLDILMDIKLQLTVELGRTELTVKKVLELTRGSIVELEKVAGEPVELYANGKLVAQGEVVVIEDNFGLRITSITDPEDRIKGI